MGFKPTPSQLQCDALSFKLLSQYELEMFSFQPYLNLHGV